MTNPYRIGTRKSPLAMKQAEIVRDALKKEYPKDKKIQNAKFVGITTSGDRMEDKSLAEIGGKALFVKEIEQALLAGDIDFAVHSLKDVESNLHPDFTLGCFLEREIPNDVLITSNSESVSLLELKPHAIVGTSSPRRAAQLLDICPDLQIIPLRGNVITRLSKFKTEEMDASVLAYAGLKRLDLINEDGDLKGYPHLKASILTLDEMIPAVGQGVLTVQTLGTNHVVKELLSKINHRKTEMCVRAERAFLREMGGSCKTPISAFCVASSLKTLFLRAFYAPIGSKSFKFEGVGNFDDPEDLGGWVGRGMMHLAMKK